MGWEGGWQRPHHAEVPTHVAKRPLTPVPARKSRSSCGRDGLPLIKALLTLPQSCSFHPSCSW